MLYLPNLFRALKFVSLGPDVPLLSSFTAYKGYDQSSVYRAVLRSNKEVNIVIHPRSNAVMSSGNKKWMHRDRHVQKILDDEI